MSIQTGKVSTLKGQIMKLGIFSRQQQQHKVPPTLVLGDSPLEYFKRRGPLTNRVTSDFIRERFLNTQTFTAADTPRLMEPPKKFIIRNMRAPLVKTPSTRNSNTNLTCQEGMIIRMVEPELPCHQSLSVDSIEGVSELAQISKQVLGGQKSIERQMSDKTNMMEMNRRSCSLSESSEYHTDNLIKITSSNLKMRNTMKSTQNNLSLIVSEEANSPGCNSSSFRHQQQMGQEN